ncbi:MAG: 50S ribosomal protein L31 [Candidatus Paceibacterota bacterium]|jgi:large subunit ribosomal protein L31
MKKEIHPEYYPKIKATCACGATYEVSSTMPEIHVEICSACHPFYTGTDKIMDTAGRVDKFKKRVATHQVVKAAVKPRTVKISKNKK